MFQFASLIVLGVACIVVSRANIHRALPGSAATVPKNFRLKSSADPAEVFEEIADDDDELQENGFLDKIYSKSNVAWLYSIPAALLVGSTGIFPLLLFPSEAGKSLREGVSSASLRILLSFAVGGLLGDVFLHLLPESWMYLQQHGLDNFAHIKIGLWVLAGMLSFLTLEKVFGEEDIEHVKEVKKEKRRKRKDLNATHHMRENGHEVATVNGKCEKRMEKNGLSNGSLKDCDKNAYGNGSSAFSGHTRKDAAIGHTYISSHLSDPDVNSKKVNVLKEEPGEMSDSDYEEEEVEVEQIKVMGYLNLLANCIDNFTHGLAVSGSFVVSTKIGMCTTLAILLHEIPHEIGDFAILLKSGFKRWDAAVGQMLTASGAVVGALFGLLAEGAGDSSAWILPFTAGGFIYIAMVTCIPDILQETKPKESLKQMLALFLGIGCMVLVTVIHH